MQKFFVVLVVLLIVCLSVPVSAETNLALGCNPTASDQGWGGGSDPWDLVDGLRTYEGTWMGGLAFTGGPGGYGGSAGPRQATIDFSSAVTFNKVILWHHGAPSHVPMQSWLEYWNGANWQSIQFQRSYDLANGGWSFPDTYVFNNVTGSKIRYGFDNSGSSITGDPMDHGWIYEFEVYNSIVPEPSSLLCLAGSLGGFAAFIRRRRS